MKKRNTPRGSPDKPLPKAEPDEDDRKPPAANDSHDNSTEQTDFCSNASHSTVVGGKPKGEEEEVMHMSTIPESQVTTQSQHQPSARQLSTRVALLGGTSAASALAFVVFILPTQALLALVLALSTAILLLHQLYHLAIQAYREAVNGRGIGDYLPSWLFSALVEESIHERMVDPSFNLEWRHLALYFFPGLSRAQIEAYVDRLPERHRHFLLRPGAGHVLGNEFMQLILGRERYPEVPSPQDHALPLLPLPTPPNRPLILRHQPEQVAEEENDDNDTVLSDHDAPVILRELAGARPPSAIVARSTARPMEESMEYDSEFVILYEAFTMGMTSMIITPFLSAARHVRNQMRLWVTRPSVSLALIGGSVGVFGYWRGMWGRHGVRSSSTMHDRDVWYTAVLGGGMASLLLLARSNRPPRRPHRRK